MRSKLLLLSLCAFCAVWIVVTAIDQVGLGQSPWWGWWDGDYFATGRPYVLQFDPPQPDGAVARAGIRAGDFLDLREQPTDVRWWLAYQPIAGRPISIAVHRGTTRFSAVVVPTTSFDADSRLKLLTLTTEVLAAIWFLASACAIATRRAALREGRILAVVLLCVAITNLQWNVPNAIASGAIYMFSAQVCIAIAWTLLVVLAAGFGRRSVVRGTFEKVAYGVAALAPAAALAFGYALTTLRFDPLTFGLDNFLGAHLTEALINAPSVLVTIIAIWAVNATPRSERARAAWLLLPVPFANVFAVAFNSFLLDVWHTWAAIQVSLLISAICNFIGALAVTYALLLRRVLDFEFVLSRTLVVAATSLIVVAAFTLLEWLLGSVLAGASHATGIAANAGLALVLGFSLRYIHKRVDTFVDAMFFRKRHEDERALLDYAKEAAYVTESSVLLDQAIDKVQRHTDARGAAILLGGDDAFAAVRSFGDRVPPAVSENDEAVVALKTWHKPLDPHRYRSALQGALALPMLARGRLLGMLLLDERSGGESYAPDEVEALSTFAFGVGAALDGQSANGTPANALVALTDAINALREDIARRLPANGPIS